MTSSQRSGKPPRSSPVKYKPVVSNDDSKSFINTSSVAVGRRSAVSQPQLASTMAKGIAAVTCVPVHRVSDERNAHYKLDGLLDLSYEASTASYSLKRKASQQLQPTRKGLRGQTDFEALLDKIDFGQKQTLKGWWLTDRIDLLEKSIAHDMVGATPDVMAWISSEKASKRADLVETRNEHRLRMELVALADEYQDNKKLVMKTATYFPLNWPHWDEETSSAMTSCYFRTNIMALGVQNAHEVLQEKRSDLVGRARKLETELKALGQALF